MFSTDFWKRQINCLNDFETVRYRVAEYTVDEAYRTIRLHNNNFGSWNLSYDNEWHDTDSSELTIDYLTWVPFMEYVDLLEVYIHYHTLLYNNQSQIDEARILRYFGVIYENHELYRQCRKKFGKNIDTSNFWSKIEDVSWTRETGVLDPVLSAELESIDNFVHCVLEDVSSRKSWALPVFSIETQCDVNKDISNDMKKLSGIQPVNYSLLEYAKKLSTIRDFKNFNKTFDSNSVEDLASATTWVHNGYIVRREDGNRFHRDLPKDLCVQHVTANLAKHLYKFPRMDFTEVYFHAVI